MSNWQEFKIILLDTKFKNMGMDDKSEYNSQTIVDLDEVICFYKSSPNEDGSPNTCLMLRSGDTIFVNEGFDKVKKLIICP